MNILIVNSSKENILHCIDGIALTNLVPLFHVVLQRLARILIIDLDKYHNIAVQ